MWRLRGALSPSTRLGEVVGLRLGSLAGGERHTLEVVSVGEPVSLADLTALATAESIDELERRGLLEVDAERRRQQVRFAHPLYAEVVRAGLPARRRQEISRELAALVEARGPHRREDTLRVAIWRLDGGGSGSPDLMLEAAHQARFAFDYPLAERLARVAWKLEPKAAVGHVLGETLDMLGRHDEAEEILHAAESAVDTDHDCGLVALGAVIEPLPRDRTHAAEAEAVAPRGRNAYPRRDPARRARAPSEPSTCCSRAGSTRRSRWSSRCSARRRRPRVRPGALPGATARALAGRTDEAITIADRAFEARVALGDQVQMAGPGVYLVARALALVESGRFAEAESNAQLGYDGAADYQLLDGQAWFAVILGRICLHQGRAASSAPLVPGGGADLRRAEPSGGALGPRRARARTRADGRHRRRRGRARGPRRRAADPDTHDGPDIERGRAWFLASAAS